MNRLIKKYNIIIITIILITNFIIPTYAQELKSESSLEVNFKIENDTLPMSNVNISIYKLASFDNETYTTEWNDMYSEYIIDFGEATDEEIISRAGEIASFVETNNIDSDYKLITDDNGRDEITFENGIYLICGEKTIKDDITYIPIPSIIQLPYTGEDGTLIYEANIELKYNMEEPEVIPPPIVDFEEEPEPNQNEIVDEDGNDKLEDILPHTGDIIAIVIGILVLVIALNVLQILNEKKKKK